MVYPVPARLQFTFPNVTCRLPAFDFHQAED
jgi:hypothetical protein